MLPLQYLNNLYNPYHFYHLGSLQDSFLNVALKELVVHYTYFRNITTNIMLLELFNLFFSLLCESMHPFTKSIRKHYLIYHFYFKMVLGENYGNRVFPFGSKFPQWLCDIHEN